ncbi:MAG TPA: hypothetical protein VI408_03195 [Gaiellaceae bacterium]
MAVDAAYPHVARPFALARGLTARVGLTLVVVCSFAARAVASAAHPVPRYFPDEYLYTAIARALGSGHTPAVRGEAAHFPALLEPLLAAPLQAAFAPDVAYRLTQAENALLMSLAAVPVYLLARRLAVSSGWSLACAAFAVLIPDLVYSSYTLADPVAYPFALAAVAAGVAGLERPSRRGHAVFFAFAGLATFARVQYVVLFAAYVFALVLLSRSRRLLLWSAAAVVPAALVGSQALGYYRNVVHLHVGGALVHWAAVDVFLLAFASGVVLVPGALVALARPRGRAEAAFSILVAAFAAALLFEAALYASNGSARFQERYLFSLLPLVSVAFGLYAKHGRPWKLPVAALSVLLLALSARVPLSGYAAADGKTDSPFLFAVFRLERAVGTANGSLVVALVAAFACGGALLVSRRGGASVAFGAALAAMAAASFGAVANDASNARQIRHDYLPANPSWVDALHAGRVTLVQTVGSPPDRAVEQLYWNRSVVREVRLGDALPTDVYAAPRIRPAADGSLTGAGPNVLFQGYAAWARFANARLVATAGTWSVWAADDTARLSLLEQGRYSDGWLARSGRLTVWPDATGHVRGTLRFSLTLPRSAQPVTVRFGKASYRVEPGRVTSVGWSLDKQGRFSIPFAAKTGRFLEDLRSVSVQSTPPVLERAPGGELAATTIS